MLAIFAPLKSSLRKYDQSQKYPGKSDADPVHSNHYGVG